MTSRLEIFTNIQVMFIVQIMGPSRRRSGHSIDMTVVVELAFRIPDLSHNESCELLAHGVNPIDIVNFIPDSNHLSFWNKRSGTLISFALV